MRKASTGGSKRLIVEEAPWNSKTLAASCSPGLPRCTTEWEGLGSRVCSAKAPPYPYPASQAAQMSHWPSRHKNNPLFLK